MYNPVNLARYVIALLARNGKTTSLRTLQTMLYLIYSDFLAAKRGRCFDEPIWADKDGPWIDSVGDAFDSFMKGCIPAEEGDMGHAPKGRDKVVADRVVEAAMDIPPKDLTRWVSRSKPVEKARKNGGRIDDEDIRRYFSRY